MEQYRMLVGGKSVFTPVENGCFESIILWSGFSWDKKWKWGMLWSKEERNLEPMTNWLCIWDTEKARGFPLIQAHRGNSHSTFQPLSPHLAATGTLRGWTPNVMWSRNCPEEAAVVTVVVIWRAQPIFQNSRACRENSDPSSANAPEGPSPRGTDHVRVAAITEGSSEIRSSEGKDPWDRLWSSSKSPPRTLKQLEGHSRVLLAGGQSWLEARKI